MTKYKQIKINLTPDQYEQVKIDAKDNNMLLSSYIKKKSNLENKLDKKNKIDPMLLYQINKIGNNINQIAKICNIEKTIDIQTLKSLSKIENHLQGILNDFSN